jgi:UDP-glucuronate decarboxylase
MKRILITGGAGFLGSHLCDRLIGQGADVVGIDNFFSGSKDNIRHLFNDPYFELIRHDVIHPLFIEVDQIYHLACPASPIHYQQNSIKTVKTNVMGTINMLGLAKRIRARILLSSSSEVYGTTTGRTGSTSGSCASSTPTARAWPSMTAASSATSSFRRSRANP